MSAKTRDVSYVHHQCQPQRLYQLEARINELAKEVAELKQQTDELERCTGVLRGQFGKLDERLRISDSTAAQLQLLQLLKGIETSIHRHFVPSSALSTWQYHMDMTKYLIARDARKLELLARLQREVPYGLTERKRVQHLVAYWSEVKWFGLNNPAYPDVTDIAAAAMFEKLLEQAGVLRIDPMFEENMLAARTWFDLRKWLAKNPID